MRFYQWLVKVSWIGRLVLEFWWVELGFFSLFLKTMVCFSGCLMSSASLQKLFSGVCSALKCSFEEFVREKVVFPSYSSTTFKSPSALILTAPVKEEGLGKGSSD